MSEKEEEVEEIDMEIDRQMLSPLNYDGLELSPLNHPESMYYHSGFPSSPQSLFHSDFLPWQMLSPLNYFESGCYSIPLSPLFSTDIAYGLNHVNLANHIDRDFTRNNQLRVTSSGVNFHHPPRPDDHNKSFQAAVMEATMGNFVEALRPMILRILNCELGKTIVEAIFPHMFSGKPPKSAFRIRYDNKRPAFKCTYICRPQFDGLPEVTEVGDVSCNNEKDVGFRVNMYELTNPYRIILYLLPPSDYCHVATIEKPVKNFICYRRESWIWTYGPPLTLTRVISGSYFQTSGPPLVLSFQSTGLVNFRIISLHYMFTIDSMGLSSHVFQDKLLELTIKMQYYSSKKCPQLIQGLSVFPIFEISAGRCVGVIEPSSTSHMLSYALEIDKISKPLKGGDVNNINSLQENLEVLTALSEIYKLPLLQIRNPSYHCHAFGHYARDFCFGSCFVSPMQNPTGNNICFLELLLPHQLKNLKGQQNFLESLVATVKYYFQCYRVTFVNIPEGERCRAIVDVPADERRTLRPESITTYQRNTSRLGRESYKIEKMDSVEQPVLKLDPVNDRRRINDRREKNQNTILSKRKRATLEHLQQLYGLTLNDAAECLDVSRSTFKRLCREYGIPRWPSHKKKRVNGEQNIEHENRSVQEAKRALAHTSLSCDLLAHSVGKSTLHTQDLVSQQREASPEVSQYVQHETPVGGITIENIDTLEKTRNSHPLQAKDQVLESINSIPLGSSQLGNQVVACLPSTNPNMRVVALQDTRKITIKAKYADDIIKFQLYTSSRIAELQKEVIKRLNLRIGTFTLKYLDSDHDWVLIACDEDLQACLSTCTGVIQMSIQSNLLG